MTSRALRAVPDQVARYAIAVRVSRVMGRGGERFLSPDIQINGCRTAVQRAGGVVDETVGEQGVFYDLDVSGAVAPDDRPGLGAALDLVRAGRIQGVVVFDLSRFSRDTAGGLRALEEIAAAGGHVLSASESIDLDTAAGVFSTTVQLAAHRLRRDEASKAWKATHARRFEMGLPHGKVPVGYRSQAGGAVVDPVLGPAVTQAFTEYAAGGVSQKDLAERLGALRGRPMRQGVISQLLRNRFYLGELEFLGETGPGRHTPLVDPAVFEQVQRRLSWERAAGPHWRAPASPAVGVVHCSVCQGPLYRQGGGNRGGAPRVDRMVCAGKMAGSCVGVGAPRVDDLEKALKEYALEVGRDLSDETPSRLAASSRAARAEAELALVEGQHRDLLATLGELGEQLGRHVLTERAYAAAAGPVEQQIDMIEARLVTLRAAEWGAVRPLAEVRSAVERIEQLWPFMSPLEQRASVAVIVPRVLVRRAAYRGEPVEQRLLPPQDEE